MANNMPLYVYVVATYDNMGLVAPYSAYQAHADAEVAARCERLSHPELDIKVLQLEVTPSKVGG